LRPRLRLAQTSLGVRLLNRRNSAHNFGLRLA
jgi:hypothetical protein